MTADSYLINHDPELVGHALDLEQPELRSILGRYTSPDGRDAGFGGRSRSASYDYRPHKEGRAMNEPSRRAHETLAADIMASPVIVVREEAFFEEIAELLADREISGVPVVNAKGRVVGVVSERDVAHALGSPLVRLAVRRPMRTGSFLRELHDRPRDERRAKDIMTSPATVAHPDTPLHTLAEIMVKERVNRLPIVLHGNLIGVVTRSDVLGALAGLDHRIIDLTKPPVVIGAGIANTYDVRSGKSLLQEAGAQGS